MPDTQTGDSIPSGKQPGVRLDNFIFNFEVKKAQSCTSAPLFVLIMWLLSIGTILIYLQRILQESYGLSNGLENFTLVFFD
jgi:hypothetical protein